MLKLKDLLQSSPDQAALGLLGASCVMETPNGLCGGIIVETEAYFGEGDPAAHSARGHTTANHSLFLGPGTIYIHRQRHHTLMDIVVGEPGVPGSVLIRAIEPRFGLDLMKRNRKKQELLDLCSGPGKLTQALGISKAHDGQNIFSDNCPIRIELATHAVDEGMIGKGTRIGITKNASAPLRYYLKGNRYTSRPSSGDKEER